MEAKVVPHERVPVPRTGAEKAMLCAFLDRYRETMIWKLKGLSKEQASRRLVPSGSTLLGVVKHLAYVERGWFQGDVAGQPIAFPWKEGEPDRDFLVEPSDTIESIVSLYEGEIAKSRAIVERASLDDLSHEDDPHSLRWILIHMIEETARHAG
ncbi:MAG TPA: DinB family protein, partial [Candidatus Limnocylindrales bacterium]|nr:DinB family protein [Candidatus Limnocylindrales bacterium]